MTTDVQNTKVEFPPSRISRRGLLVGAGLFAAGLVSLREVRQARLPRAAVFLARGQHYDGPLVRTVEDGLAAVGLNLAALRGKHVLLKPNLVEPSRDCPQMTTHPAMIIAAAEVFRRHGARVTIGEGPGHVRDTELILAESGVGEALDSARLEYVDLNYDDVATAPNLGGCSALPAFYFPHAALAADLVVSMPKLKTHHWVGMTCALKNMYGVLPGIQYGWPKNVLHHAGIPETVFDIAASLPNTITIVDAIDCMEGDGPIMGSLKHVGMIAVGLNPTAVDATCARVMGLKPERISYLQLASDRLGPLATSRIEERGEAWSELASPFEMLDRPHLNQLRAGSRGELTS